MWSKLHPTIEDVRRGGLASQTQAAMYAQIWTPGGPQNRFWDLLEPWRLSDQGRWVANSLRLILASRCQVGGGQRRYLSIFPKKQGLGSGQILRRKGAKCAHLGFREKKSGKKGAQNHKTSVPFFEKRRFFKSQSAYFQEFSTFSQKGRFCGAGSISGFWFWASSVSKSPQRGNEPCRLPETAPRGRKIDFSVPPGIRGPEISPGPFQILKK